MSQIGFYGTDEKRGSGIVSNAVDRCDCLQFQRVAGGRAGAVGLHVIHLRGPNAGASQGVFDDGLLRLAAGHGEAGAGAVLVHGGAEDYAPDAVAVGFGVAEAFEDQHPAAFAADVSVGGGVEGFAASAGRQHPGAGAGFHDVAGQDEADAAGQGDVGFVLAQAGDRLMNGYQRRRAGSVQGNGRAAQAEGVGDAPDGGAARAAGGGVEAGGRAGGCAVKVQCHLAIVAVGETAVHAGAAAL